MQNYTGVRSTAGISAEQLDVGLRSHMNKVYGTMSVGMLITALAAWAISGLATTADGGLTPLGTALYTSPLRWVIMFAPLAFVFGFGAMINRMSAATAQVVFYAFAATMGVSISWIVIGLIVASIINIFLGSPAIMFAVSILGVLIFAGLTAYDTQKIKNDYLQMAHAGDQEWLAKSAIMGALNLYLDFINMFMFLLQLLGNRE